VPEIIVEIGNSHEGSLGIAMSMVDMVENIGGRTVKFQMHLPEFESTRDEPFRKPFSSQDLSRFEYWERVNFSFDNWTKLINYVKTKNMEFLCTPFSIEAARWLFNNNAVRRWKVGSGDATNFPLIDFLIETQLPMIISTGLATAGEIRQLKERLLFRGAWDRVTLLHCISKYPVPAHETALHIIGELKKLGCSVGYSDHSGEIYAPLLALSAGAEIVEVHMTPHKDFFGPDTQASLVPEEILHLIRYCDLSDRTVSDVRSKDELFAEVTETAAIFRKGLYWSRDLNAGEIAQLEDLCQLKPCLGVDSIHIDEVVGKVLDSNVRHLEPVSFSNLRDK
jgi:N,N'-diacetyllegionaminate synthase